jgi:hypothetical protein
MEGKRHSVVNEFDGINGRHPAAGVGGCGCGCSANRMLRDERQAVTAHAEELLHPGNTPAGRLPTTAYLRRLVHSSNSKRFGPDCRCLLVWR